VTKPVVDPFAAILKAMGGDLAAMESGLRADDVLELKEAARIYGKRASRLLKHQPVAERMRMAFVSGAYWQMEREEVNRRLAGLPDTEEADGEK
jgi:hypothetical protein